MTMDNSSGTLDFGFKPSMDAPSKESDFDSPLVDFWCEGAGYYVKSGFTKQNPPKQWRRVYVRGKIEQGDVIETTGDIYPYPHSELSWFYSEPEESYKNSRQGVSDWEALSQSVRAIYGEAYDGWNSFEDLFGGAIKDPANGSMPSKMGRRYRMKRMPNTIATGPNDCKCEPPQTKWHGEVKMAFQIVEVEGVGVLEGEQVAGGGASLKDYTLALADGKTESAFYEAALDDEKVMGNPQLVGQLTNHTFVQTIIDSGFLTKDTEGVLHKV